MLYTFDGMDKLEENTNWAGSAGLKNTWEDKPEADSSSVGAKDINEKPQVEAGHAVRKRQLTTSFMYRNKHKKDFVWLSR